MTSSFPVSIKKIGVFALSHAPDETLLARGLANLSQVLPREVTVCCECAALPRRFAGSDEMRAGRFNELVADPDVGLLLAARGGYGVTRVLEKLDFEALRLSGKTLCGYSDVTALLLAAWKAGCRRLIHGPMVCSSLAQDSSSQEFLLEMSSFLQVIDGKWRFQTNGWRPLVLKAGQGRGPAVPCNLTLLCALLGTPFLPELRGAILMLEDVHEPSHAIDRLLNQLRQAGILSRLGGLVYGQFTEGEDSEYLPDILREYAEFVPGPVVSGYPLGHAHPSLAVPLGCPMTLSAPSDALY